MIEDQVLISFLDKVATEALKEIKDKGSLSVENAMPLILKSQFNHVLHLDKEITEIREGMVTEKSLNDFKYTIDKEITELKDNVKSISNHLTIGFSVLGILIAVIGIVMPILTK